MLANQILTKPKFDFLMLDMVIEYVEKNRKTYENEAPSVILYHSMVKCYRNIQEASHYENLREQYSIMKDFSQEERKDQKDYDARPAKLSEKTKREVVFNSIFKKSPCYTQL